MVIYIMYTNVSMLVYVIESKPEKGEIARLSKWKGKEEIYAVFCVTWG